MRYRAADPSMEPQLRALWNRVFGDPEAYLDLFFRRCFDPAETMVACEGDQVRAMLYLLPLTLRAGAQAFSARYVYAVATDPDFRSRGLSTALLEETHRALAARGIAASVLVPAEPSLFAYYGARGYATAFWAESREIAPGEGEMIPLRETSLAAQKPLRDAWFSRCALYGEWDENALRYREAETAFLGGKVFSFPTEKSHGYAVCVPVSDAVRITEFVGPADTRVLRALAAAFGKPRVCMRAPAENGAPFAMLYPYRDLPVRPDRSAALTLVLD